MERQLIEQIVKVDSNFNEAMFKTYVDNVFVKLLTAIMLDELDHVKHFLNESVYRQMKEKQDKLSKENLREMYDELNVKSTEIKDFKETAEEFQITVELISRYMDYFVYKDTGDYVRGNNQSRIEKRNILIFTKKKTNLLQKAVRKCPGCGAAISVNTNGVCKYCGATYNLSDYEYILTSFVTQ